jgi:hypothetical protein
VQVSRPTTSISHPGCGLDTPFAIAQGYSTTTRSNSFPKSGGKVAITFVLS